MASVIQWLQQQGDGQVLAGPAAQRGAGPRARPGIAQHLAHGFGPALQEGTRTAPCFCLRSLC